MAEVEGTFEGEVGESEPVVDQEQAQSHAIVRASLGLLFAAFAFLFYLGGVVIGVIAIIVNQPEWVWASGIMVLAGLTGTISAYLLLGGHGG